MERISRIRSTLFIMVGCRTCYVIHTYCYHLYVFCKSGDFSDRLIGHTCMALTHEHTCTHKKKKKKKKKEKKKIKKEAETLFRVVLKYILLWQYVYMVVAAKIFLYATMFCLPVFVICSGISAPYLSISLSTMMYYDHYEGNFSPFYRR